MQLAQRLAYHIFCPPLLLECNGDCPMCRMAYQAVRDAQDMLDQLQTQWDEAFEAYAADPNNNLKKERYTDLTSSLRRLEAVLQSLAAALAAHASGWQLYCALCFSACIQSCYLQLRSSFVHLASSCLLSGPLPFKEENLHIHIRFFPLQLGCKAAI